MSVIIRVKLCVRPDSVCLQGGCGYCRYGTFKTVKWLRQYAKRNALLKDFEYGLARRWPNQEKKVSDA